MWRRLVAHPFLFAIYPVVFLFAQNLDEQVDISVALRPSAFLLACATLMFLVLGVVFKSLRRAGLVTSVFVVLFFSFGHVQSLLGLSDSLLLVLWAIVAIGAVVLTLRSKSDLGGATMVLNVLAAVLVAMNLIPIVTNAVSGDGSEGDVPRAGSDDLPDEPGEAEGAARDIYYLIFDRYANEQVLEDRFGYDNSPFLDFLEQKGFYVAHESAANHQRTPHSLASSLNISYLNYLEERFPGSSDYGPVHRLIRRARVVEFLKSAGYRYHHIGSWWQPTKQIPAADVNYVYDALSEFSTVLLKESLWPALSDAVGLEDDFSIRGTQPERVAFQFASLGEVEEDPAPTFTFAHFLVPHPPYVFDRDGNELTEETVESRSAEENYVDQLIYTNRLIEEMVEDLLDQPSGPDPIVIIQADEGPHPPRLFEEQGKFDWTNATDEELREKLLILNALYLPGADDAPLHPRISPVNTFRIVLNEYFGTDLKLLDDRSFVWRDGSHLYDFTEVTERLRD